MDLHGWEFLAHDSSYFDVNPTHDHKDKPNSESGDSLDSDYFLCPSPTAPKTTRPDHLDPVPIPLEPNTVDALEDEILRGISENPDEAKAEQRAASQVSSETKGDQFVDTKMNPINTDDFSFDKEMRHGNEEGDRNGGFNLWKWSFTGIGAICTFGVTAAAVCILFIGTQQQNKSHQNQKNIIKFYTDDKNIKRVMEHATKLNEAISASGRGGPLARAHITYDTYTDGLLSND